MLKSFVSALVVLVITVSSAASARAADPPAALLAMEREAIDLIEQIDEVGRDVQYHGERIQHYIDANIGVSHWTHYHHLESVKDLVNDRMRPALRRLDALQAQMPEWKQESIDRMVTAAGALAKDASSAFITKGQITSIVPSLNQDYRNLVRDLTAHAADLVRTADAAHVYATARVKATEVGLLVLR